MAVVGQRITVTTAPTRLDATAETDYVPGTATAPWHHGQTLLVTNRDASRSVDLGGLGVAAGAGYELVAGASLQIDLETGDVPYAITASGTVRCDVIQGGV